MSLAGPEWAQESQGTWGSLDMPDLRSLSCQDDLHPNQCFSVGNGYMISNQTRCY